MNIYSKQTPDGKEVVLFDAPITDSAVLHRSISGDNYIQLSFIHPERIDLCKGCYVRYKIEGLNYDFRFEVMSNVYPEFSPREGGWKYNVKFETRQAHMKHYNVFYDAQGVREVSFMNMSTLEAFAGLIANSMNLANVGFTWKGGVRFPDNYDPADFERKTSMLKTISFKGDKVWDAASRIAEEFGVEWWTEENGDEIFICFGKLERGTDVDIRAGEIVSTLPARKGDSADYGTRFYVFGSTRNLTRDYYEPPKTDKK